MTDGREEHERSYDAVTSFVALPKWFIGGMSVLFIPILVGVIGGAMQVSSIEAKIGIIQSSQMALHEDIRNMSEKLLNHLINDRIHLPALNRLDERLLHLERRLTRMEDQIIGTE